MTVRVGINGFGRIGRNFLRAARAQGADVEVVAVNDLTDAATNAHLLRYDTTHGRFGAEVRAEDDTIVVAAGRIRVLAERDPKALPGRSWAPRWWWSRRGASPPAPAPPPTSRAGPSGWSSPLRRRTPTPPSSWASTTTTFDPARHVVVSNASCTTNCFVPMVKVLDDAFGVRNGLMTTVHAYTNDQNLLDLPHADLRRARAAAQNIVPASTGAARATGLVLPAMQGRLDGTALRVPVGDGSITDFTALVPRAVTVDEVNEAFRQAATEPDRWPAVLEYTEDPIVSSDIVGSAASCTFDAGLTMVMPVDDDTTLVKVQGWYDNEWGYANRLVDLVALLGRGRPPAVLSAAPGRVAVTTMADRRGPTAARPRGCRCSRTSPTWRDAGSSSASTSTCPSATGRRGRSSSTTTSASGPPSPRCRG